MADKIKKAILWIRKTLEITERTDVPASIDSKIIPTLEILGWERYADMETETQSTSDSSIISSLTVPEGTNRLYIAASVDTNDIVNQFTYWVEAWPLNGTQVGIIAPNTPPTQRGTSFIRSGGLPRPFLMGPGGRLRGRLSPATAGGATISIRTVFIDIPIGEYIPPI